jgi:hypothetical protein
MLTFSEFSNLIEFDRDIRSCASLLSESDVDPAEFVGSFLEEDLHEGWKDWLAGAGKKVASGIGRLGQAAGEVGSSLWDGGLKSGVAKGADTVAGPAVKFDKALGILRNLADYLSKNDMTKNLPSVGGISQGKNWTVGQYITAVANALEKEKNNIPQMQKAQVSQSMAPRDGGASLSAAQTPKTAGGPVKNVPPHEAVPGATGTRDLLGPDGNPWRKVV